MNTKDLFIAVQDATNTVVLDRESIDFLIKGFDLNTLEHYNQLAMTIAHENGYDKSKNWMLGAMTKEDADYLTSFLTDEKFDIVEFVTE